MKAVKIFFPGLLTILVLFGLNSFMLSKSKLKAGVSTSNGFAVVELFTSEGCSSCPAADAVAAKIQRESAGKNIYILAYHVDYWNRLGWRDVYSSAEFSRRQSKYAGWLHLSSVYTPQVIVNGKTEFVGSEEGRLRNVINANLNQPAGLSLALNEPKLNANTASVHYETNAGSGHEVVLALVQKNAVTEVKAGENAGRSLSHIQVVNSFQAVPVSGASGNVSLKLPVDFSVKKFELIGFVQDTKTGEISAANRISFVTPL